MRRDTGAPEGSRVQHVEKSGMKPNQSSPSFQVLAREEKTWNILDVCEDLAGKYSKTVAQVRLYSTVARAKSKS